MRSFTAIISARAVTGAIPALLRYWNAKSGGFALRSSLRERLPGGVLCQITLPGTGGEFTAWLPASHQTGRSLNSCADTYLRVGLLLGWIIPAWGGMSSCIKLV